MRTTKPEYTVDERNNLPVSVTLSAALIPVVNGPVIYQNVSVWSDEPPSKIARHKILGRLTHPTLRRTFSSPSGFGNAMRGGLFPVSNIRHD